MPAYLPERKGKEQLPRHATTVPRRNRGSALWFVVTAIVALVSQSARDTIGDSDDSWRQFPTSPDKNAGSCKFFVATNSLA